MKTREDIRQLKAKFINVLTLLLFSQFSFVLLLSVLYLLLINNSATNIPHLATINI